MKRFFALVFLFAAAVFFSGCKKAPGRAGPSVMGKGLPSGGELAGRGEEAASFGTFPRGKEESLITARLEKAAVIAASLNDKLLSGQVLLSGVDGKDSLSGGMKKLLLETSPGGIMLFKYNLDSGKDGIHSFLEECSIYIEEVSGIVPFMAADHEGGLVHRFGPHAEKLPAASSYWDMAQTSGREKALTELEKAASVSAEEIRALGITMNLAPVAEVLDSENALFLETRSYGPEGQFVEEAASAFIRGMDASGIASVVKHFPGNSSEDPHYSRAVLEKDKAALDIMVEPFAGIIARMSPSAIMVSHILVPAVDPNSIASLSPAVLQTWLRGELKFRGVIITDDFSMSAAAELAPGEAAVEALAAGADVVMVWPSNAAAVHGAILKALGEERLPRARLLEAAGRVIAEKLRFKLLEYPRSGKKEGTLQEEPR